MKNNDKEVNKCPPPHTHRLFMQKVNDLNYYKFIAIYFF
jgi:hypothetical protein